MTEEEEAELTENQGETADTYEFWIDDETLKFMFVGMKMTATVRELSFGLTYIDRIIGTYCSFLRQLPNNLMDGWREHKYIPPAAKVSNGTDPDGGLEAPDDEG
jgi:Argonaute siRNA chaperone (ARC) complex subunit Arb1